MPNVQVLGLVETKEDDGTTPRSQQAIEDDIQLYKDHVPAISGFYLNEVGTPKVDVPYHENTDSHITTLLGISSAKLKKCPKKYPFPAEANYVDLICFKTHDEATGTVNAGKESDNKCGWCCMKDQDCSAYASGCTEQKCEDLADYFVAFGVGEPLFDTSAVVKAGTPDLWITLNDKSSKLGVWTPYSWFSSLSNEYVFSSKNWGAIVTEVTNKLDYGTKKVKESPATDSILTQLFDRGYGYVFMTTESLFPTASSQLDSLITGIHKKKTNDNDWAPPTT